MTPPISPKKVDALEWPSDLRKSLGEKLLLQITLEAASRVDWSTANLPAQGKPRLRPQMMLTLLTYCYAAGCYDSHELELAIQHDPTMRYICAHGFPDWMEIRQFRRQHRALLEQCLTHVLERAWMIQIAQLGGEGTGCDRLGPDLSRLLAAAARDRIETAVILDRANND